MLDYKQKPNQGSVAAEMKFKRKSLDFNWTDYKTSTGKSNELKITSVTEKIKI